MLIKFIIQVLASLKDENIFTSMPFFLVIATSFSVKRFIIISSEMINASAFNPSFFTFGKPSELRYPNILLKEPASFRKSEITPWSL